VAVVGVWVCGVIQGVTRVVDPNLHGTQYQ
jgi:hypothetical protein